MKPQITQHVINVYHKADDAQKKVLIEIFGEDLKKSVPPKDITQRVFNLKSACQELGKDINTLFAEEKDPYHQARIAIETFAEAMREGKAAKDCYYYPYFLRSSGGGFSFSGYGNVSGYANVGARLRFPDSKTATHAGKCMLEYYKSLDNG